MNPAPRKTWLGDIAADCDWSLANIPFGVGVLPSGGAPACLTRVGDWVVDLRALSAAGMLPSGAISVALQETSLNGFMALGRSAVRSVRARLQALLAAAGEAGADSALAENAPLRAAAVAEAASVVMRMPARVPNYTDFYSSREHASNVGVMMRGPANALQPNWLHLPVGYHGRASSVVPSGAPVRRPCGQLQAENERPEAGSIYAATRQLDFELEIGAFVGPGSELGEPVAMTDAEAHLFGVVLLNDWSARDIQKWEYVPLGPFGSKNFATTVSPWVVTFDALEPFRCAASAGVQAPTPLPYLRDPAYGSYDIHLEVTLRPAGAANAATICRTNFACMYWNFKQQLVHHTVTGCNLESGDLLGSGTISGAAPDSFGSMLELAWKGTKPLPMPDGSTRTFLLDGDEVVMRGWCERDGVRVGLGECAGVVTPAKPFVSPSAAPVV